MTNCFTHILILHIFMNALFAHPIVATLYKCFVVTCFIVTISIMTVGSCANWCNLLVLLVQMCDNFKPVKCQQKTNIVNNVITKCSPLLVSCIFIIFLQLSINSLNCVRLCCVKQMLSTSLSRAKQ